MGERISLGEREGNKSVFLVEEEEEEEEEDDGGHL